MKDSKDLEKRIEKIEERNRRVEIDKTWELSYTRRILIMVFIYLSIGFYFQAINIPEPWLNSIVPAIAFMFSMLTLPLFRELWLKYIYKK